MDVTLEQLATALTTALKEVLDPDEFDVALGVASDTRELDLATDDWTIHLEGWPETVGWLAIDDEPEDSSQFDSARRAVMPESVEQAIAQADREVGGSLSRALATSNDPFTMALVSAVT
jgi:hypothetical protein